MLILAAADLVPVDPVQRLAASPPAMSPHRTPRAAWAVAARRGDDYRRRSRSEDEAAAGCRLRDCPVRRATFGFARRGSRWSEPRDRPRCMAAHESPRPADYHLLWPAKRPVLDVPERLARSELHDRTQGLEPTMKLAGPRHTATLVPKGQVPPCTGSAHLVSSPREGVPHAERAAWCEHDSLCLVSARPDRDRVVVDPELEIGEPGAADRSRGRSRGAYAAGRARSQRGLRARWRRS